MEKSGQKNRIVLDLGLIRLIIARDGRVFAPSSGGRLMQISQKGGSLSPEQVLSVLCRGEALSNPGGRSFEAAKKLLESYRRFTPVFRGAADDPFDQQGSPAGSPQNAEGSPIPSGLSGRITPDLVLSSSPGIFEQSRRPSVDPKELFTMVNDAVERMLDSSSSLQQDMGELLYARYIKPEYGEKPTEFYMALFRCSRATWFRLQNQAISSLAIWLFGPFPAE